MIPNKSFNVAPFSNTGYHTDAASLRHNPKQRARLISRRGDSVHAGEALDRVACPQ